MLKTTKFPSAIIQGAWRRTGGKCECSFSVHGHGPKCNKVLQWHLQNSSAEGGWFAVEKSPGAPPNLNNCIIMCNECKRMGRGVGF